MTVALNAWAGIYSTVPFRVTPPPSTLGGQIQAVGRRPISESLLAGHFFAKNSENPYFLLERRGGVTPRKLSGTGSVKERERDFAEPGSAGPPPPPRAPAAGAEFWVTG